jgi:hypothetical protein
MLRNQYTQIIIKKSKSIKLEPNEILIEKV